MKYLLTLWLGLLPLLSLAQPGSDVDALLETVESDKAGDVDRADHAGNRDQVLGHVHRGIIGTGRLHGEADQAEGESGTDRDHDPAAIAHSGMVAGEKTGGRDQREGKIVERSREAIMRFRPGPFRPAGAGDFGG